MRKSFDAAFRDKVALEAVKEEKSWLSWPASTGFMLIRSSDGKSSFWHLFRIFSLTGEKKGQASGVAH